MLQIMNELIGKEHKNLSDVNVMKHPFYHYSRHYMTTEHRSVIYVSRVLQIHLAQVNTYLHWIGYKKGRVNIVFEILKMKTE